MPEEISSVSTIPSRTFPIPSRIPPSHSEFEVLCLFSPSAILLRTDNGGNVLPFCKPHHHKYRDGLFGHRRSCVASLGWNSTEDGKRSRGYSDHHWSCEAFPHQTWTTAPADHRKILALVLCICNIVGAALSEVGYLPFQSNLLVNGGLKVSYNLRDCTSSTIKARGGR